MIKRRLQAKKKNQNRIVDVFEVLSNTFLLCLTQQYSPKYRGERVQFSMQITLNMFDSMEKVKKKRIWQFKVISSPDYIYCVYCLSLLPRIESNNNMYNKSGGRDIYENAWHTTKIFLSSPPFFLFRTCAEIC